MTTFVTGSGGFIGPQWSDDHKENPVGRTIPEDPTLQMELARKWQELRDLSQFDRPDEPGAWNLLYALHGIEESCRALVDLQIPALVRAQDSRQLQAALTDIGDELTHLLFHVRDARYFDYLSADERSTT